MTWPLIFGQLNEVQVRLLHQIGNGDVCMYVCMYVRMSGDLLDVVEVDFIVDDELGDHLLLLLALEEQHNTTQHNTTQHNTTQHMSTQWSAAIEREKDGWMDGWMKM